MSYIWKSIKRFVSTEQNIKYQIFGTQPIKAKENGCHFADKILIHFIV